MKPSGCGTQPPKDPLDPLCPVQCFSVPEAPSMKWKRIACDPMCTESLVCRAMAPVASPIAGPQGRSQALPTVTLIGAFGGSGERPAHCGALFSKFTQTSPDAVTAQDAAPWQAPPQPAKVESCAACAVRATEVPVCAGIVQAPGQSIPAGLEVTRPAPAPGGTTVSRNMPGGDGVNTAVTWRSAFMFREQVSAPEQSPCQPAKALPPSAVATRSTVPPPAMSKRQSLRQETDGLALCTVPPPDTRITNGCEADPLGRESAGDARSRLPAIRTLPG